MIAKLKYLRNKKGISQEKLANALGDISQQSINKYENHKIEPDIQMLIKLADFFDTSVDFLIGHTNIEQTIDSLTEFHLTDKEISLVDSFRKMTPHQQECIKELLLSFTEENQQSL